jgi:hypothetical protein
MSPPNARTPDRSIDLGKNKVNGCGAPIFTGPDKEERDRVEAVAEGAERAHHVDDPGWEETGLWQDNGTRDQRIFGRTDR